MVKLHQLWNVRNDADVLPRGTWKRFEEVPRLAGREREITQEVHDRLARFGMAFDWERWERVSVNPFVHGDDVTYYGVYGETIVVEGYLYVNDVVDGDHLYVSPGDAPFFCLHRGVFETNDAELYRRVAGSASDPAGPGSAAPAVAVPNLALAAARYILEKAGVGELTLEANRETGQRLLIAPGRRSIVYE